MADTTVVLIQGPPMKEEIRTGNGLIQVLMSRERLDAWQSYQTALTSDVAETLRNPYGPPAPAPAPPAPFIPEPTTGRTPAEILNIGSAPGQNHFKLQLAEKGQSKFIEISQDQLAAGFESAPLFYAEDDYAVVMAAQLGAPTTSGTKYSRCELREMTADGEKMGFDALTGFHSLAGVSEIVEQPIEKPDIVVAQLHDGNRDRISIRTQKFSTGELRLVCRINGSVQNGSADLLGAPYTPGRQFGWAIIVDEGLVSIYIDGTLAFTKPAGILESTGSPSWYFKAGCYNQSTEDPNLWGVVRLRALDCTHS